VEAIEMTTETKTTLGSLFQINMPVKDIDRAVGFYRDVLGLPFYARRGNLAFLGAGEVRLLLEVLDEEGGRYNHPGSVLYFSVADIDAAYRDLCERGVEFVQAPEVVSRNEHRETWMAFFSDGEWNTHAITAEVPIAG
jgi:predicted enzyme related to lactoylglutathione lyase